MGRLNTPPLFYKGERMNLMTLTFTGYDHDCSVCNDIREILRKIDPMFDIAIDCDTGDFVVFHNGTIFQRTPCNEFDRDTIQQIGRVVWLNLYGDIISEIDAHNNKLEKSRKSEYDYIIGEISKDVAKYGAKL